MGISNRKSESNKYDLEDIVEGKLGKTFVYKEKKGDTKGDRKFNNSGRHNIKIERSNYNEKIEGNYNEYIAGDYIEQKGNFGIGHMSGGEIKGNAKVAGINNETKNQDTIEVANEIQTLIQKLEQSYPTKTATEKMIVATKVIEQIENNPTWKQKAIAAFNQGNLQAIETDQIGVFTIGAIRGWKEFPET